MDRTREGSLVKDKALYMSGKPRSKWKHLEVTRVWNADYISGWTDISEPNAEISKTFGHVPQRHTYPQVYSFKLKSILGSTSADTWHKSQNESTSQHKAVIDGDRRV